MIYALADAAASDAVRSAGAGASAVVDAHIAYLNAAREGDVLVAKAGEASRTAGGDAVWRVEVATEGGRPIATLASTIRFEAAPRR